MTATTAIAKLNDATVALHEAFENHGTEWNEIGKTLVNFQKPERVAEMAGCIDYMGTIRDSFKNYDFAIAKAAPLIADIASKRQPCDLFYGDDSDEDVKACEEVSLALSDFVACFDKSDEEIAAEIFDFIKEKDSDVTFNFGHPIVNTWDKGTNPNDITSFDVADVLILVLENWSRYEEFNIGTVRMLAMMYLEVLCSNSVIREVLATEWLGIIRAQWTTEED
jgi:hypothetical protein